MRLSPLRSAPALAAALLAAAPAAARAQACAPGTLAAYLAAPSCTLSGWEFSNFQFDPTSDATGAATAAAPDPAAVLVTPFTALDVLGRTTFGLRFAGLAATAQVPGGSGNEGAASAEFVLAWSTQPLTPGATISRAGIAFGFEAATGTPGRTGLYGGVGFLVADALLFAGSVCLLDLVERFGPESRTYDVERRCEPDRPPAGVITIVQAVAEVTRPAGARPAAGTSTAGIGEVRYVVPLAVVPEPSAAALVAAGLAGAGLSARRRRRA